MSTPDDFGIDLYTVEAAKRMLDHSLDNNLSDVNSTKTVYHHYVEKFNEDFPASKIIIEDKYQ